MIIYSHWTLFNSGRDCSLHRAITLNRGEMLPIHPTSPLFPGCLLISPATSCSFLLPFRMDHGDCLVVFASLSTGGSQIQQPSTPSTVHPPTRSVSTQLLVSLLTWHGVEGTLPSLWFLYCPPKGIRYVGEHTFPSSPHVPDFPLSLHLIESTNKQKAINKTQCSWPWKGASFHFPFNRILMISSKPCVFF